MTHAYPNLVGRLPAGIRLPPNGMLVLLRWGVAEKVVAKSVKCMITDFVDSESFSALWVAPTLLHQMGCRLPLHLLMEVLRRA